MDIVQPLFIIYIPGSLKNKSYITKKVKVFEWYIFKETYTVVTLLRLTNVNPSNKQHNPPLFKINIQKKK